MHPQRKPVSRPVRRSSRNTRRVVAAVGLAAVGITAAALYARKVRGRAGEVRPAIPGAIEPGRRDAPLANGSRSNEREGVRAESHPETRNAKSETQPGARRNGNRSTKAPQDIFRPFGKFPAYPTEKALEYIQRETRKEFDLSRTITKPVEGSLIEIEWNWRWINPATGRMQLVPQKTYVYCSSVSGGVEINQFGPLTNSPEYAKDKASGQKAQQIGLTQYLKSVGGKVTLIHPPKSK